MTAIIVYHHPCADGIASAWVTKKYLVEECCPEEEVVLVGANYDRKYKPRLATEIAIATTRDGDKPDIFFVDFSEPYEDLLKLAELANTITVIDHHKTAQAELEGRDWPDNVQVVFDMAESGATLCWLTFFDADPEGVPKLLRYIKDRDLWEWKLSGSKEVSEVIYLKTRTMEDFEAFAETFDEKDALASGALLLAMRDTQVKRMLNRWHKMAVPHPDVEIGSVTVPALNSAHYSSELGNDLAAEHPEADFVCIYSISDGMVNVSIRVGDKDFDASPIAKFNGGGGHAKACGFRFAISDLPERLVFLNA